MKSEGLVFKDSEGYEIFVYKWLPDSNEEIKGVVQIAHGMAEHALRYERFAGALTNMGYVVYANDHRGHGRTAKVVEEVGYTGRDGFKGMARDLKHLNEIINEQNPGLPVYLFGHSMGSLLAQYYMIHYRDGFKGVILSGTSRERGIMLDIGTMLAKREIRRHGEKYRSSMLNALTFGSYNKAFRPVRTKFDWLSRDEQEVDKYIDDPFCGTIFTCSFFYDLFRGIKEIHEAENMNNIQKELPIFILSGEKDPVGKNCKSVLWLMDSYKKLGIKDVTYKFYKDGRHEMLNETNKEEVMDDVVKWLDEH